MAKRQPTRTIVEMEAELGFGVNSVTPLEAGDEGFYSDLSRVSNDALEFFKQEYAAMVRMKQLCRKQSIRSGLQLPNAGESIVRLLGMWRTWRCQLIVCRLSSRTDRAFRFLAILPWGIIALLLN